MNTLPLLPSVLLFTCVSLMADEQAWSLHTIDASSRGADGVRFADVNQDGRVDLVTGWEEGGQVRICLQPEAADIRMPWPSILVGQVRSPEDAVFADINADGWLDVISCCEGKQQSIFFHINPGRDHIQQSAAWRTELLASSRNRTRWMFCEPLGDGRFIFGSKDPRAEIAIWDPDQPEALTTLRSSGWIMSLRRHDVDGDGDPDVIYSDRKGNAQGVGWLENPGSANSEWLDHLIGGRNLEVMFLDVAIDGGKPRVVCNTRAGCLLEMVPTTDVTAPWQVAKIAHPPGVGDGKGVAICDVDLVGRQDLICTCEHAAGKVGIYWLQRPDKPALDSKGQQRWLFRDISRAAHGVKFDQVRIMDIDQDGDADVITCEERDNLGVIWYENPLR